MAFQFPQPLASKMKSVLTLPSKGKLYGDKVPGGKIEITPLTGEQEVILNGAGEDEETTRSIIQSVSTFPAELMDDMLSDDFRFLTVHVMAFSFTDQFRFTSVCSECGHNDVFTVNLPDLKCAMAGKRFDDTFDIEWDIRAEEPVNLKLKRLTLKDIDMISKEIKNSEHVRRMIQQESGDNKAGGNRAARMVIMLANMIVEVNGQETKSKKDIRDWLRSLPYASLIEAHELAGEHSIGYPSVIEHQCSNCGTEAQLPLKLGPSFRKRKHHAS